MEILDFALFMFIYTLTCESGIGCEMVAHLFLGKGQNLRRKKIYILHLERVSSIHYSARTMTKKNALNSLSHSRAIFT